jgi:hypothetical protein
MCLASCQGQLYATNDWNPVQVWDGIATATKAAGITGPTLVIGAPTAAAGGFDNGQHQIRYRYKNTNTGYVSNPSPALVYTVSGGNGLLTFGIGAADDIRPTTDTKVNQYVIEATPIGGGTFYQAGTAAVGAASVQVGMADTSLIQQFNSSAEYGSEADLETYSNEVPPLGTILLPYRGRMWVLGDAAYPLTAVTFTNGSAAVTGTNFSTSWAGRLILRSGDTVRYEIASVTNTTSLTLSAVYGGTTGSASATVVSKFPNRGYYSRIFYPEQFFTLRWARDFLANRSDQVVAAVGRKDAMYVFGRYSAERLIYNADPSAAAGAVLSPIQGRRGCFQQRCIVDVEGELYAWDRQGMWIVNEVPKHISTPIDPLLETYIDYDQNTKFHASFDPVGRIVMFFFVQASDTQPKYAACFELDTGRWFFDSWLQGITASSVVPTTDGQVRLMLGDENGYSWYFGIDGSFDGPPPTVSSVLTVTGSPTTTVIPVTETLPTSGVALNGVMVYDPISGESRYSSSNTSSAITVASAFTTAPTVGQEIYLGPIQFEYRTKWWVGSGQEIRKNPPFLLIKLFPGSDTGTARVYFYADFATSPSQVTKFVTDTFPDGVVPPTSGQYYLEVNLDGGSGDGVLSVPVPIEWNDAIQARITSVRPDGDLRILDLQFVITRQEQKSDIGD